VLVAITLTHSADTTVKDAEKGGRILITLPGETDDEGLDFSETGSNHGAEKREIS